jgi:DNA polymerase III subunit delta
MKEAASKTKGLHLLAGSDHYAVQKAALALTTKLAPEDPLNFEIIDAQVEGVEAAVRQISELKAAVLTLPFMGGGKLIWWKNVNFLNDDVQGRSASVLEALEAVLPALDAVDGQSVTLVISALGVDRRRSFYKQLGKLGEVQAFDLPDARKMTPEEIIEKVERAVLAAGLKLETEIIDRLAQTCGLNPRALDQTVQKLVTAAGPEKNSAPKKPAGWSRARKKA